MGRKKLGNVLYAKRIHPELAERVDALIKAEIERRHAGTMAAIEEWFRNTYGYEMPVYVNEPPSGENLNMLVPHATNQIKLLLDDVERLTKEVEGWKRRHGAAVEATQDQLATYWKREYFKLKAQIEAGEGDCST